MHISLTPELEKIVKDKVASGLYNNASEVIREALRFMQTNEDLVQQLKLDSLRQKLDGGMADLEAGRYRELSQNDLDSFFQALKNRAQKRLEDESQ